MHVLTQNDRGLPETSVDEGATTILDDTYVYDKNGNVTQIIESRPAGSTLFTVAHDVRGNQTSRTTGAVTDTFTFDKANRLTASNVGGTAATYRYDGLGRRMQHTESGVSSYFQYGQAGQLLYSHDGTHRIYHIHLAGSLVAKRLIPYAGGPTTTRFQHTDALGSPVAETDEVGALIERERMTAYGEPADGGWKDGPGFTGHDMDATSKLVYMQQRYYDPAIGRFLSVDPLAASANTGGMFNRYNYANNNPHRFVDPDGRAPRGCGSGSCSEKPKRDWRSASLRARALAGGRRLASSSGQAAPQNARTFGPLKGAYTSATENPTQPIRYPKGEAPNYSGISLSVGWSTKVHAGIIGASIETAASFNGRGEICKVAASCLTLGPGLFADTGPSGSLGFGQMEAEARYVGVTVEAGKLLTIGADVDFNGSGASLSRSGGAGAGMMIAAKICEVNSATGAGCQ